MNQLDTINSQVNVDLANEEIIAEPLTPETRKHYAEKLLLLTEIHAEIAPELNRRRELDFAVLHSREDAYIPETGESLLDLWLANEPLTCPIPID